jgi:voltage-gated potassium channel Kch
MADAATSTSQPPSDHYVVIAGFGLPGRFIAELLDYHGVDYSVIELNPAVVRRCQNSRLVQGDVRDPAVLARAGLERATLMAITIPSDQIVHEAVAIVHRLRPELRIIARAEYTSSGLKALKLGAHSAVIAEQVVAREFFRIIDNALTGRDTPAPAAP